MARVAVVDPVDPSASPEPAQQKTSFQSDAKRWRKFLDTWVEHSNQTVHLYDPQGQKLIKRHIVNKRKVGVQMNKYCKDVLDHGVMPELRGTIVVIPSEANKGPNSHQYLDVIGGGTLFEAIYAAQEINSSNEYCIDLKKHGVSNCIILKRDTPESELRWCKSVHNRFHGGLADTLAERLRAVPLVICEWKDECRIKRLSVSSLPKSGPLTYEKQYEHFVLTHHGQLWKKWIYYDNTKSVVSALKDFGAFESFCDDLEENVDLSHPELKAQDAINYMHELKCVIFNSDFSRVVDPVTLGYVFMECLYPPAISIINTLKLRILTRCISSAHFLDLPGDIQTLNTINSTHIIDRLIGTCAASLTTARTRTRGSSRVRPKSWMAFSAQWEDRSCTLMLPQRSAKS